MKLKAVMMLLLVLLLTSQAFGADQIPSRWDWAGTDVRPDVEWATHSLGSLTTALMNIGTWADPDGTLFSMNWPESVDNNYLWQAGIWTGVYGEVTPSGTEAKWASVADYGDWEFWPSEGFPMVYQNPGVVATEESSYGVDDWYESNTYQEEPFGIQVNVKNSSWDAPGYDNFIATEMIFTHNSAYGNPGVPLNGFAPALRGDCDIASADSVNGGIDDLVYYDGHAIWANGTHTFDYQFPDGTPASTQDDYIYQQNPDSPLPTSDPGNIFYHYNYMGTDGVPDKDVDQNGVSDHFTIIARVVGSDTLYTTDPVYGIELFSEGMPYSCYDHVVGDTTYLVVPRNLSYMWDSDSAGSGEDDSGEQANSIPCTGFVGWRLLDFYVVRSDKSIERPADVWGYPIPLSHSWWNWEGDPGTDADMYDYMWGLHPETAAPVSGPSWMTNWVGNPDTPEAMTLSNPGPFPIVQDSPLNIGLPTFDYRFLISAGVCDLADGDQLYVVGGWVAGNGLEGLRLNADIMLDAYYRGGVWGGGMGIDEADAGDQQVSLRISPNPVSGGMLSASFNLAEPSSASVTVFDVTGRIVHSANASDLSSGANTLSIDSSRLGSGIYFAVVRTGDTTLRGRFAVVE